MVYVPAQLSSSAYCSAVFPPAFWPYSIPFFSETYPNYDLVDDKEAERGSTQDDKQQLAQDNNDDLDALDAFIAHVPVWPRSALLLAMSPFPIASLAASTSSLLNA